MATKLIKWLVIVALLACCYLLSAGNAFDFIRQVNNNNQMMYRIINNTNRGAECYVRSQAGYYQPIYVPARSSSDWYYEPYGYYEWRCR